MRNVFQKIIKIKLSIIVLTVLLIGLLAVIYFYFYLPHDKNTAKLEAVLASLSAGIFVAVIQFILSWQSFRANEKIATLGVKEILLTRDDRQFYENYLKRSSKEIDMMGSTGQRFLNDFADKEGSASKGARILLDVLNRGVKVRILMPKKKYLSEGDQSKADIAHTRLMELEQEFEKFEYRYYDHLPAHGMFRVDNENIVGPIFPNGTSKNTPAIHLEDNSPYANKYHEYFNLEWKMADIKI
jgi:hypothetical protein